MTEEEHKNTLILILSVASLALFTVLIAVQILPEEPYPWTQDRKPIEAPRALQQF